MITDAIQRFYDRVALDFGSTIDSLMFGEITGYRKTKVTRYLHLPVPFIERHYDTDSEYGTGEFEGLLFNFRWIKTPIPIGKETIKVPIRQKRKGQTIRFRRYTPLDLL